MRLTQIGSWPTAVFATFALVTTTVSLVAFAPRAHADDEFYFDLLNGLDVYKQYGDQRMLQEAHKICDLFKQGANEDTANSMIASELGISTYEAYRVVTAAEFAYGCLSVKFHNQ